VSRPGGRENRQNVTLVLPADLIAAAKHLAVDDDTTLSGLVARLLADEVARRDDHRAALMRVRERLARGYDLGTRGRITVSRDELHDR
jgi:DNA-binding transcriptional MocR family regulator